MKLLLYLGMILVLMSFVSAPNYFGLLNSSDEFSVDEMISGLNFDETENNTQNNITEFKPTSRPMSDKEVGRFVLIIVVVLGVALLLFNALLWYWKYGGRNLP